MSARNHENNVRVAKLMQSVIVAYLKQVVEANIADDLHDRASDDEDLQQAMELPFDVEEVQRLIKNSKKFQVVVDDILTEAVSGMSYMTEGAGG